MPPILEIANAAALLIGLVAFIATARTASLALVIWLGRPHNRIDQP